MSSKLPTSALLILLSVIIYSQSPVLLQLLGQANIDKTRLIKWSDSKPLNNHDCKVIHKADACEDVKIHYASNTAFLACGDPIGRTYWYPCAGVRHPEKRAEASFREQLFKYDITTGLTTKLELEGCKEEEDDDDDDDDDDDAFTHIPTSSPTYSDFYITNDHFFARGPLRFLEETYGPFTWSTNVQYCDANNPQVTCKQATGTFPGANGINSWNDRLFVGDARNGTVTVFEIQEDKSLKWSRQIDLGAAADNINILPTTGDPIVAVFPTLEDLPAYLDNVRSLGKDFLVPAAALRLDSARDYTPELIYFDDGSVVSFMTTGAVDPYNKLFIGSSVLQFGGFAVLVSRDTYLTR
ncbi:hypothetical protein B0A52_06328 [Exophiala mesophila]|uniref:SMP-30/Gluconolactonase/LRE-like region domain-containing protein n=1 Tax=Exophiala mesophila TaxID=212818 RepID=A0A438N213_EXOME|nr:hypothetical protein B0A52_06328 [Exophiala mesophila]